MPEASGNSRRANPKTLTATAAVTAAVAGWWVAGVYDPPRAVPLALVGVGAVGMTYFSLRPLLRPRHSHSSLPLFPVLVVG